MISPELKQALESELSSSLDTECKIEGSNSIGGGCINQAARIKTNLGDFFIKWNLADAFPKMFDNEKLGLEILHDTNEIHIPKPIATGKINNTSFIVLEYVESSNQQNDFSENFGRALANLHKHTNDLFGLNHDNYIGSLPQFNDRRDSWPTFFIEERLERQVQMAIVVGKIPNQTVEQFHELYKLIPNIFPDEPPALLHGDLWSGNYMINKDGQACIMDPAVYYGSREAEIAFTKLFGGFDLTFYASYNEVFPLQTGYEERIDLLNLYPLMVHVNLFGGGYLGQVQSILSRF
ncbi:MAG: ketosamine-3-kinase [Bacteroidetes bacterium]|nr:MAG: ketosamine-3-kinase [Bacteroidota bacterium]